MDNESARTGTGCETAYDSYWSESNLTGMVVTQASQRSDDFLKTFVDIGKESTITGCLYITGYLSLQGSVHGSVMTHFFLFRSSSTLYENYLVDGVIDRSLLSGYFASVPVFASSGRLVVVEWLAPYSGYLFY
jgi:hypothetical protein